MPIPVCGSWRQAADLAEAVVREKGGDDWPIHWGESGGLHTAHAVIRTRDATSAEGGQGLTVLLYPHGSAGGRQGSTHLIEVRRSNRGSN